MRPFTYCDGWDAPTGELGVAMRSQDRNLPFSLHYHSTDLTIPFSTPAGVTEIFQGVNGRAPPLPNMPVLVVHHQFLLPGVAQQLDKMPFKKAVQIDFAREASTALLARSQSSRLCSDWLKNFSRQRNDSNTPDIFGYAERVYYPRAAKSEDDPHRPNLLICIRAPPGGALLHSIGYPHSAIRLLPGDAILCPSTSGEIVREPQPGVMLFIRLRGDPFDSTSIFNLPSSKSKAKSGKSATTTLEDAPSKKPVSTKKAQKQKRKEEERIRNLRTEAEKAEQEKKMEDRVGRAVKQGFEPIIQGYEARIAELEAGLAAERARAESRGGGAGAAALAGKEPGARERREDSQARQAGSAAPLPHAVRVEKELGSARYARDEKTEVKVKEEKVKEERVKKEKVKEEKGRAGKSRSTGAPNTSVKVKDEPLGADDFLIIDQPYRGTAAHIPQAAKSKSKRKADDSAGDINTGGKRRKS